MFMWRLHTNLLHLMHLHSLKNTTNFYLSMLAAGMGAEGAAESWWRRWDSRGGWQACGLLAAGPGERLAWAQHRWSLAGLRLPNLTSLHRTRAERDFYFFFPKGLINWADLGRFGENFCLWGGSSSQPCGPVSSCRDFSAEWLKGFLF